MTPAQSHVSSEPLLRLTGIGKRFGGAVALQGVDWSLDRGEVHCLVGENGSGKSTLIKILAGVHAPDPGGRIEIDGKSHDSLTPQESRGLGIQVIFQDLSLFPNLTVLENVAFGFQLNRVLLPPPRRAMRRAALDALSRLGANLPLNARVGSLPVAQRQIVAICRGIVANARIVFMDEPTASLTRREVALLVAAVARLKTLGVAVVFVSHRLEEVIEIAERVTVLRDGRKVGTYPASTLNEHRIAELMTGETLSRTLRARDLDGKLPALEVSGAARAGEFENVSFVLRSGEVLGLIGLLGAGRTELALSLFGMTSLERGALRLSGKSLRLRDNQDAIRNGIAYVSEDRLTLGLNLRQSIADNIAVAVLDRLAGALKLVTPGRRRNLARRWVARLAVKTSSVEAAVQTLSGGNQQRIVLAKWLATDPKVLILDSPTAGVDIRNKQDIYDVVRELAERGVSILLISDEIPEVYFNCDRILCMREGRLVSEFVPGRAREQDLAEALYA